MTTPHTTMRTLIPLPVPRTPEAPSFDGKRLTDFLSILRQHGQRAGLTDDELTPYILQYCTEDVKNILRFSDELKPSAKSWKDAVEEMQSFYASEDKPVRFSVDNLRQFCNETSAKPPFESKNDVELYYRRFREISGTILEDKRLSEEQVNLYFVAGLPMKTLKIVEAKLPEANRVTSAPPKIKAVRKILNEMFVENSLQSFARQNFMDLDVQAAPQETKTAQKVVRFEPVPAPAPPSRPVDPVMDDFIARMEQMQIANTERFAAIESKLASGGKTGNRPPTPPGERRCFVCGNSGVHQLGWKNCPTAKELFDENLVMGDINGRLVARDGSDLPSTREPGGMAAVLRQRARENANRGNTASLSAQFDGHDVIGGDRFSVSANDASIRYAEPALRSGRDTSGRQEPYAKPQAKPKASGSKPPTQNSNPPQPPPAGPSLSDFRHETPPHMNPGQAPKMAGVLTKKTKSDKGKGKEDTEMPDAQKRQWRFTSDIQESVSTDKVCSDVYQTPITLPLGHLLAVSPPLQKKTQEMTHRRREYVSSNGEYEIFSPEVAKSAADGSLATGSTRARFLMNHFRSNRAFPTHSSRYLAFATGMVTVSIMDHDVRCLVDTGSELNLISNEIVQTIGLPNDIEGTRWPLTGVNGGSDRLVGLCRDVPMKVGGHNFDHHLFISRHSPGKQEIILGQPWIQWFSGRIDLDRSGSMDLVLWKDGDRSHAPTISVRLLRPGNERNQTAFQPANHRAFVTEVSDEEENFP
ncbi:hypothetical protein B0H13DRAFT_2303939 [Mycena leptocephala]|nr:hypothetical protein B0H13DRAFT_2303939 [Mycena leptocephala]